MVVSEAAKGSVAHNPSTSKSTLPMDAQRHLQHLLLNVDRGAIRPRALRLLRMSAHGSAVASKLLGLEDGIEDLALLPVRLALTYQEGRLSDRVIRVQHEPAFVKCAGIINKHAADRRGRA